MLPTLRDGDRVLVRYQAPVRTGQIVLVRLPDSSHGPRPIAIKRLRRIEPGGWLWVESERPGAGTDSWDTGALAPTALMGRVLMRLPRRPHRGAPRR